ncbi:hypothetical protein DFH07DRAFT_969579 [Mycena maculata]|uniref:Uncharacterized protein n=1 Tax=Mycena maculata TaxID=230809 RepID=A0AAD7HVM1_9AGAR|nr:hypothetical protein DFH07DRAFT_969579 [Mycena maculata]
MGRLTGDREGRASNMRVNGTRHRHWTALHQARHPSRTRQSSYHQHHTPTPALILPPPLATLARPRRQQPVRNTLPAGAPPSRKPPAAPSALPSARSLLLAERRASCPRPRASPRALLAWAAPSRPNLAP